MRVCQFCEKWESGGIESFLFNVLTHADLSGLEVDIVASQLCESVFTEPLKALGVRFIELSGNQRDLPKNRRMFRQLLRRRQYDVIHLNVFQGLALYYGKIAAEEGVPVRLAHSHNSALRKSPTRIFKMALHTWAKEQYTRYATGLWACSTMAAEFLFSAKELGQKKFQFIPNGIDTGRFRFDPAVREAVRAEMGLSDVFVLGNVGRLCYQKNQDFLLDVFAEVLKRRPNSRLLLVGEGEDKPHLEQKTKELNLTDKVIFYGVTQHVERLLWAMDVFAFPSRFEGLSVVAVEVQTAGLPVLWSDRISEETCVTGQVSVLPLEAGAERWAEKILSLTAPNREAGAQEVQAAGFDVAQTAKLVIDGYKGAR